MHGHEPHEQQGRPTSCAAPPAPAKSRPRQEPRRPAGSGAIPGGTGPRRPRPRRGGAERGPSPRAHIVRRAQQRGHRTPATRTARRRPWPTTSSAAASARSAAPAKSAASRSLKQHAAPAGTRRTTVSAMAAAFTAKAVPASHAGEAVGQAEHVRVGVRLLVVLAARAPQPAVPDAAVVADLGQPRDRPGSGRCSGRSARRRRCGSSVARRTASARRRERGEPAIRSDVAPCRSRACTVLARSTIADEHGQQARRAPATRTATTFNCSRRCAGGGAAAASCNSMARPASAGETDRQPGARRGAAAADPHGVMRGAATRNGPIASASAPERRNTSTASAGEHTSGSP